MIGNYELERAKMEAARNEAEFKYFEARPQIDTIDRHRVFQAGFERAWEAAKKEGVERKIEGLAALLGESRSNARLGLNLGNHLMCN